MTSQTVKTIVIEQASDSESPRDWDNLGTIYAWHRNYSLGDEQPNEDPDEVLAELGDAVILPVYMYEHSGISLSTSPFSCRWDSGQLGFIAVTRERIKQEFPDWKRLTKKRIEQIKSILESEIKVYDDFASGNVHGFTLYEHSINEMDDPEAGEQLDSCWGFFGDDDKYENNGMSEHWPEDWKDTCRIMSYGRVLHEPDSFKLLEEEAA